MNQADFKIYQDKIAQPAVIRLDEIHFPEHSRTLIWGYTHERHSFHVYVKGGELHRVIYSNDKEVLDYIHGDSLLAENLCPSKRAYPCATELHISLMLHGMGYPLPFTTFNESREDKDFHGFTFDEL